MPVRIGFDLVCVDEVRRAMLEHGQRYLARVYTSTELDESGGDARHLALRFAAKEAAIKVLGSEEDAIPWRSIGVRSGSRGRPRLELTDRAADLASARMIDRFSLSFARTGSLAGAIVVAELGSGERA